MNGYRSHQAWRLEDQDRFGDLYPRCLGANGDSVISLSAPNRPTDRTDPPWTDLELFTNPPWSFREVVKL